jgi:hypothetical protein
VGEKSTGSLFHSMTTTTRQGSLPHFRGYGIPGF